MQHYSTLCLAYLCNKISSTPFCVLFSHCYNVSKRKNKIFHFFCFLYIVKCIGNKPAFFADKLNLSFKVKYSDVFCGSYSSFVTPFSSEV